MVTVVPSSSFLIIFFLPLAFTFLFSPPLPLTQLEFPIPMAGKRAISAFALLICFMLLNEEVIFLAEGRFLVEQKVEEKHTVSNSIEVAEKPGAESMDVGSMARASLDDARPSVPGHSPGIGHDIVTKDSVKQ